MRVYASLVFSLTIGLLYIIGCDKNSSPLGISLNVNLIRNSSFEANKQPSLKYWYVENTTKIDFSNDTPAGGGKWSVYLPAKHYGPLPLSPSYFVPLPPGKYILNFSVYGKSKTITNGGAYLILKKGYQREIVTQHLIADSVWTEYAAIDTLNIRANDSLFVLLTGGFTEILGGYTYFDRVNLEVLSDN